MSKHIARVLWMPLDLPWQPPPADHTPCCAAMREALEFECAQHTDPFECADTTLVYHDIFAEYGIPVRDGGASYLLISHCPWCGAKLPQSQRDAWFEAIDTAGLRDVATYDLPPKFQSSAWRKS